jgi:hypothetical protein
MKTAQNQKPSPKPTEKNEYKNYHLRFQEKHVEATAEIDCDDDPTEAFITLQDWVHSQLTKSPNLIGSVADSGEIF